MKNNELSACITKIGKWGVKYHKGLLDGGILGFSLAVIYLLSRKKKLGRPVSFNGAGLNMEKYVFDISTGQGIRNAVVESGGDCYGVSLDGRYLGSMWHEASRMQWNTKDEVLRPYLRDIAAHLSAAFSCEGFPSLLKGAYPEIVSTEWKSSETLEVVISIEADLEVFSTFLKDEMPNLIDFDEHLDLVVKKADNAYFVIVGIN